MDVVIVVGIVVHRCMSASCFSQIYHDLWIPVYARSLVELQRNGGKKREWKKCHYY